MSTKLADVQNEALVGVSVYPATVNDTNNGSAVDMIDADGSCFAIQFIGTVGGTSPSLTGKIQESADNVTWTDVPAAAFTAVTASNNVQTITFERTKRYLRHFRTVSGTSPTFPLGVLIGEQKKSI
jgi:Flp pilus assembly protein TadG